MQWGPASDFFVFDGEGFEEEVEDTVDECTVDGYEEENGFCCEEFNGGKEVFLEEGREGVLLGVELGVERSVSCAMSDICCFSLNYNWLEMNQRISDCIW